MSDTERFLEVAIASGQGIAPYRVLVWYSYSVIEAK